MRQILETWLLHSSLQKSWRTKRKTHLKFTIYYENTKNSRRYRRKILAILIFPESTHLFQISVTILTCILFMNSSIGVLQMMKTMIRKRTQNRFHFFLGHFKSSALCIMGVNCLQNQFQVKKSCTLQTLNLTSGCILRNFGIAKFQRTLDLASTSTWQQVKVTNFVSGVCRWISLMKSENSEQEL